MADVNWNLAVTPDPFKQIAEGRDYSRSIFDQAALLKAGSQYAAGDPASAANTVASRGDFKTAGDLSTLATRRQAGQLYAGGDAAGAGKALAGGGDFETAGKLQEQQIKTIEAQQDAMGRTGSFLTAALADPNLAQNPNLPQQAWGLARQQLQAAQIPPERIAEFEKMFAADPKKAAAIMSHIATEVKVTSDGQGTLYLTDKYGNVVNKLGGDRAYPGTSPESTDLNNLLRGVKDPAFRSTPEYAAAWNRQNAQKDQIINGKFVSIPGNVGSWAPAPGAYQGAPAPAPAASSQNEPPPPSGTPTLAVPPGATSRAAPINPAPPPLSVDDMYKAVSKRDGIPEDTLREWAKDPEDIQRLYAQPIGPAAAAPQTVPSAAGAPSQGGPTPAASAQPVPGAPNVRVADIPGLERPQNYNPAGPIYDANNRLIGQGRWNDTTGEYEVQQPNGAWGKMPAGARVMPQNTGGPPSATAYNKLKLEFTEEQIALRQLDRYFANVGNLDTGLARLATQISANVKTAFGTGKLTPQELNRQLAAGEFQGLQGLFRTDIGGGGVLTGPDVDRVKAALGGDVTLLQNPQVVKVLLGQIYQDKRERLQTLKQEYDRAAPYYGEQGKEITVPETLGGNAKPQSSRGPYAPGRGPQYDLLKKYGIE